LVYIIDRKILSTNVKYLLPIFSFVWLFIDSFFLLKNKKAEDVLVRKLIDITIFVLFVIASTGWFKSPFFFVVYLLSIIIAFVYSNIAGLGFIVSLITIFLISLERINPASDSMILASLILAFPTAIILRNKYIKFQEEQKRILVVENERKNHKNSTGELHENPLILFAISLRTQINDIKQLAYELKEVSGQEAEKDRSRIIASCEEALRILKRFEQKTLGKRTLKTLNY